MTNREMLINALLDRNDDRRQTESDIAYHIACPYRSKEKGACDDLDYPFTELDVCAPCIMEWLDKEVLE